MKVRGAVLRQMGLPAPYAQSKPLSIEEIELAPPGPGELLVRVRAAGLCHSDLSVIDGSRPRVMPMLLGHEATGEVVETGTHVAGFGRGDQVVFSFVPACGHCAPCASGRAALCEPGAKANVAGTLLAGERRLKSADGSALNHHLGVSGFAEYTVVSAHSAVKIAEPLAPEVAALFGCAVMTGVGAVVNTARVAPGDSVAIFGLGGVGLSVLLGAVAAGANPIVAVDVVPAKLELAKSLGATHTILAQSSGTVEAVKDATAGGTTITLGLPHPDKKFSIPAVSLVAEERTVKGSYMGSAVPSRDIPRFVALHRAGRLPVERLLTDRLRLSDINAAFDRLARGEAVRQVILFE